MKNLTPLQLPQVDTIPLSPQNGFYKIYLRGGVVYKLDSNGVETPIGNFVETEPLFTSSPAFNITNGNISQWNTAYGWGDHASAGYLKTESDPVFTASPAGGITNSLISQWITAYNWGNHATQGYLTQPVANTLYAPLGHTHTFASITSKPTTLSGYGITDPIVLTSNVYSDPSWITALSWSKIVGAPSFVTALAALTDVSLTPLSENQLLRYSGGFWRNWTPDFMSQALADTLYIGFALRGAPNGVASLNAAGQVPASQLPSYVDDVVEYASPAVFPNPGETGKIYVALNTNETYRWTGSGYVKIVGGEVQSVNFKVGNVILNTDDIPEGTNNLYYTNARVKTYADTLYPSLATLYNNPTWINTLAWSKITGAPAFAYSTGTTNYVTKWAANGALVNSIIFENGGVGINTNAVNVQAMLHVMGNNVRTKSLTLDSTWDYQTSFNMKNGNYSAEFNLGGVTKSSNEGGPGSLQVSTYNALTNQFRYPVTFFGNGNVAFAGQLGSVPADNGSTLQVTGTIQQSSVTSALLKANSFGQLVAAVPDVDYVVNVPTPTLQFVSSAGNTTTNRIILNTSTSGNYPLTINDNTNAFVVLNVVNPTGTRNGGIRFQSQGADRNVLLFNENGNLVFARYASGTFVGDTMSLFNATGNVGIGTSTDVGYRLDVSGTTRFKGTDTGSTQGVRIENSDASWYYNFQNNGYLIMNGYLSVPVIDQSSLNIRSNNLLIGATGSTLARVQISGSVTASGAVARGLYLNTAQVAAANNDILVALDIDSSFTNGAFTGVTNIALRTTSGEVRHLGLPNQTSASMMYYDQTTGRLSYGAAPATPTLQSVTDAGNTTTNSITLTSGTLKVTPPTSAVNGDAFVAVTNATTGGGAFYIKNSTDSIYYGGFSSDPTQQLRFANYVSGKPMLFYAGGADRMTIFSTGNVGINTTTDAGFKLDVNGTARVQGNLSIINNQGLTFYNANNQFSSHYITTANEILTVTNGNVYGAWKFNGYNVSISKNLAVGSTITDFTNPAYRFSVTGTSLFTGSITASSAIARGVYFNNTLVAAANNDVLVGLDIEPTFTNGAFTGVTNHAVRITNPSASFLTFNLTNTTGVRYGGFRFQQSGIDRFTFAYDNSANFIISRFNSTGVWQGDSLTVFNATGNLSLGNSGVATDAGYRFDVNGSVRFTAAGNTSATSSFLIQSSIGGTLLTMRDDGKFGLNAGINTNAVLNVGGNLYASYIYGAWIVSASIGLDTGTALQYSTSGITSYRNSNYTHASGTISFLTLNVPFAPTSGTGVHNVLNISPTINQTGGANGITRGLLIDPTLTAAADFRAIETVRGNVLFATTTGSVGIGTSAPGAPLHVNAPSTGLVDIFKVTKSGGSNSYFGVFSNTSTQMHFDPAFLGFHAQNGGNSALQFIGGMDAAVDLSTESPLVSFQARKGGVNGSPVVNRDLFEFQNYGTSVLRIKNNGNVLIGTTTDAGYKLDVNGSTRFKGDGWFDSNDAGQSVLRVGSNTNVYFRVNSLGAVSAQSFSTNAGNTNLLSDGTVRIASTLSSASALTIGEYTSGGNFLVFRGAFTTPFMYWSQAGLQFGNNASAVTSALVEFNSTTKGFLQPRMTNAQAVAITTPATGLQVYDTTNNKNLLYTGSAWQNIATEAWVLANAPQTWTTASGFIYYNSGNVVVGNTTNAGYLFDVNGTARITGTLTLNQYAAIKYGNNTGGGQSQQLIQVDGASGWSFAITNFTGVPYMDIRYDGRITMGTGMDVLSLPTSALLNLVSTTQGFLAPRMTTAQRTAIASPATGLMVFDTTVNRVSTYSGSTWEVFARELERRFDTVGDAMYVGKAISGSSESANVWTIKRIVTTSSGEAIVTTATNVAWTDRLTASYS